MKTKRAEPKPVWCLVNTFGRASRAQPTKLDAKAMRDDFGIPKDERIIRYVPSTRGTEKALMVLGEIEKAIRSFLRWENKGSHGRSPKWEADWLEQTENLALAITKIAKIRSRR